jgi:hypothetical protein
MAQVLKLHAKQFFSYGRQHPCDGHIGQLIVRQIQRKTHAFHVLEPPEEL